MSEKLKPCPFCGADSRKMILEADIGGICTTIKIVCQECGNHHSFNYATSKISGGRIIDDWNRWVEEHSGYAVPQEVKK